MNETDSQLARLADDDLVEAERLAALLGTQVGHVAALREQLAAQIDVAAVAAEAKEVRASLRAAELERNAVLGRWAMVPVRLDELDVLERTVAGTIARCREMVPSAPPLQVPSVSAVRAQVATVQPDELAGLTWPSLRSRLAPVLANLDRVAAELADLDQRCRLLLGGDG